MSGKKQDQPDGWQASSSPFRPRKSSSPATTPPQTPAKSQTQGTPKRTVSSVSRGEGTPSRSIPSPRDIHSPNQMQPIRSFTNNPSGNVGPPLSPRSHEATITSMINRHVTTPLAQANHPRVAPAPGSGYLPAGVAPPPRAFPQARRNVVLYAQNENAQGQAQGQPQAQGQAQSHNHLLAALPHRPAAAARGHERNLSGSTMVSDISDTSTLVAGPPPRQIPIPIRHQLQGGQACPRCGNPVGMGRAVHYCVRYDEGNWPVEVWVYP